MSAGTFYKTFSSADRTTTRTLLHENIPITGALVSGTYAIATPTRDESVKTFSHGMFQSAYDYPFLSSSANHLFDITYGFSTAPTSMSGAARAAGDPTVAKKVNVYNQMAQVLVGYDTTGSIRRFDVDGDLSGGAAHDSVFFLNFSRLLVKDEIKKGSFSFTLSTGSAHGDGHRATGEDLVITDAGAATSYKVNSPAGEYGLLKDRGVNVGLLYYQAGIAVLTSSVMGLEGRNVSTANSERPQCLLESYNGTIVQAMTGAGDFNTSIENFTKRIKNISFNNTTELNSTIYFCRANHNEFNYSSNPTYVSGALIRVKDVELDQPISYITTIGLYSSTGELLATAKLSEPLRKDPTNELTLRVRLDY